MDPSWLEPTFYEKHFSETTYQNLRSFFATETPKVSLLYNSDYGGFDLSERAKELYQLYTANPIPKYIFDKHRCDPYITQIFHELGSKAFSAPYASVKCIEIPEYMIGFFRVYDEDGREFIVFHPDKCKIALIRFVLQSSHDTSTKCDILQAIVEKKIPYIF
jgi:hypothetical protein